MDDDQQFCLRWNNHQSTLISVFDTLLENGTLVDCTLAAEGQFLKAHKVVLSACSPYFASLLSQQYDKHPIFILKDVKFQELRAMMDYMYRGEVNISQDQLAALLKAAESLQIKGLSDSRGGNSSTNAGSGQKSEHNKPLSVPVSTTGKASGISSGYTLEQKRPRHAMGALSIDTQELAGSREGSSSPTSRKRKKIRRRSLDNIMADNHEHSNSSSHSMQINSSTAPSNTSAAAATAVAPSTSSSTSTTSAALLVSGAATGLNVTKKTDNIKDTNVEQDMENDGDDDHTDQHQENNKNIHMKKEQNHKRKSQVVDTDNKDNDMLIEPKSEYDDGNDETVEDLTLDEEELLEDLEQAGPSHGGEGSSQGYAQWQVDRSQDEVFLAAQEAAGQQRDPQGKQDKSEQTDVKTDEYELDDCLLESNDIVITQNKDGFVLHVKKLGNVTTAKLTQAETEAIHAVTGGHHQQAEHQTAHASTTIEKSQSTLASTCTIKLPSAECELINVKKEPVNSTATTVRTITAPITITQAGHPIVAPSAQTIGSIFGLQEINFNSKVIAPRIKYSRAKYPSPTHQGSGSQPTITAVQMTEKLSSVQDADKKYEITEIDLNQQASASIINDLVKYAEIDDIELPDGTKIGIGFAPAEITEQTTQSVQATQVTNEPSSASQSPVQSGTGQSITKSYTILTTTPMKTQQAYELSLSDSSMTQSEEIDKLYVCRHCGKKYRWKSTLRRHENVECGGKEPCHPCPYCNYKAKQRGNLGVHVRKHHPEKPQLESKRGRRSM